MDAEGIPLFITSYLTLNLLSQRRIIHAIWCGSLTEAQIHEGCEQILTQRRDYGIASLLNDNRAVNDDWLHSVEWVAQDWYPRARQSGLHYIANIYSCDQMAHISTDTALTIAASLYGLSALQAGDCLGIRTFENLNDGLRWLETPGKRL